MTWRDKSPFWVDRAFLLLSAAENTILGVSIIILLTIPPPGTAGEGVLFASF